MRRLSSNYTFGPGLTRGEEAGAIGNFQPRVACAALSGEAFQRMADIHLHRARLFFREKNYPWKSPQDDLVAETLINDYGYHRRDEELADAKRGILRA